jgi:hypothetical protein
VADSGHDADLFEVFDSFEGAGELWGEGDEFDGFVFAVVALDVLFAVAVHDGVEPGKGFEEHFLWMDAISTWVEEWAFAVGAEKFGSVVGVA